MSTETQIQPPPRTGVIMGAAFLMATSAIGPGFQTQITVFTEQLAASFAFVILLTTLIEISTQVNTWRVLTVTGCRAQDLANKLLPGLGYFLSVLVLIGGLAFNIGNIAGCGLGLEVMTGMNPLLGALISAGVALLLFWMKNAGPVVDNFVKVLGVLMILLALYVAIRSRPPVLDALRSSVAPARISLRAIVTLVGGSVGGYIAFVGPHRLLDAGISGRKNIRLVNESVLTGVAITGSLRVLLFLASLGVVAAGAIIARENPAASVFEIAAGRLGYRIFGLIMWSASITSVVGAAYTSVSFFRSFHPWIESNYRYLTSLLIVFSFVAFGVLGKPVRLLLAAGAINGLILPVSLSVILVAAGRKSIMGAYHHPYPLRFAGWLVVASMTYIGYLAIRELMGT